MKTAKNKKVFLTNTVKNERLLEISALHSLFRAVRHPGFYFDGECHSQWEMVHVISGSMGISADDRVYTLHAGDVIFHKPMEFHRIWAEGDTPSETFILSFDPEGTYVHALEKVVLHLREEEQAQMEALLRLLAEKSGVKPANGEADYLRGIPRDKPLFQLVIKYLETLFLTLALSEKVPLDVKHDRRARLYTQIVELLEENVYGSITIPEIARRCDVSAATVKSCFAAYAGCGIHKYLLKIKMRAAVELLESGLLVREVSEQLGFSDPNYFSVVFKRETGHSPTAYVSVGTARTK